MGEFEADIRLVFSNAKLYNIRYKDVPNGVWALADQCVTSSLRRFHAAIAPAAKHVMPKPSPALPREPLRAAEASSHMCTLIGVPSPGRPVQTEGSLTCSPLDSDRSLSTNSRQKPRLGLKTTLARVSPFVSIFSTSSHVCRMEVVFENLWGDASCKPVVRRRSACPRPPERSRRCIAVHHVAVDAIVVAAVDVDCRVMHITAYHLYHLGVAIEGHSGHVARRSRFRLTERARMRKLEQKWQARVTNREKAQRKELEVRKHANTTFKVSCGT